ncbi:MAG: tetratricopeptide repeat protein [Planctomycetota bacterium]
MAGAGIFGVVALCFLPALRNGFVDWDDPDHILRNERFRGLGAEQLRWMFTTAHMGHYQPLSWISLACDYLVGRTVFGNGLDPRPYHFTSLLLHAASAVLAYHIALRLLVAAWRGQDARGPNGPAQVRAGSDWGLHAAAALAALFFAAHPLRVESVAWATERRDVLSSFFLLATVLAYLRANTPGDNATRTSRWTWLGVALAMYVLSLLSRAMGVTLPLILLLVDWYPLRRFDRVVDRKVTAGAAGKQRGRAVFGALIEKIPFIVAAVVFAGLAVWAQRSAGATYGLERHDLAGRLAQACYGFVFYVTKTLWPAGLSPIYEVRLPIEPATPRYLMPMLVVAVALLTLTALAILRRGRGPAVAAACYLILLLPVSGLVQSGNQEVADRYSYLPGYVLAITAAGGVAALWRGRSVRMAATSLGVGTAAVVVLGALTWRQCAAWESTATLWTHAAAVQPGSSIAQNGCGFALLEARQYDEAVVHLRRALEIQPANDKAHQNLWRAWREQGRRDEYLAALRESVRIFPNFADAHFALGLELAERGQEAEAEQAYAAAIRLRPNHSAALTNRAQILWRRGERDEALRHYEAGAQADERNVIAWRGWAALLNELGRRDEALQKLRHALSVKPDDARAQQYWQEWTGAPPP